MKTLIAAMFILLTNFLSAQEYLSLPSSTLIVVQTTNELSGRKLQNGQSINCVVVLDIVVEGDTLIKAGAPVFCFVDEAEGSGMVGHGGNLSISIQNTVAIDGTNIPLTGSFSNKGESRVGEKLAIGLLLCPFVLLSHGEEAIIPSGAQIRAFTIGEHKIKIKKNAMKNSEIEL